MKSFFLRVAQNFVSCIARATKIFLCAVAQNSRARQNLVARHTSAKIMCHILKSVKSKGTWFKRKQAWPCIPIKVLRKLGQATKPISTWCSEKFLRKFLACNTLNLCSQLRSAYIFICGWVFLPESSENMDTTMTSNDKSLAQWLKYLSASLFSFTDCGLNTSTTLDTSHTRIQYLAYDFLKKVFGRVKISFQT